MTKCPFCNSVDPLLENQYCQAFFDQHPVSKGHLLLIPKAHHETYFELTLEEKAALADLIEEGKKYLDATFAPDGYNIGANCGEAAGQTISHCHIHLIPRYHGDMEDPSGGVRGVIPDKQKYKATGHSF